MKYKDLLLNGAAATLLTACSFLPGIRGINDNVSSSNATNPPVTYSTINPESVTNPKPIQAQSTTEQDKIYRFGVPGVTKNPISYRFVAFRNTLVDDIERYTSRSGADVAVAVTDLQTMQTIHVDGDVPHRPGCTINMFAMFTVIDDFQNGRASLETGENAIRLGIRNSDPGNVKIFLEDYYGDIYTGAQKVQEWMDSHGIDGVFDHVPTYGGSQGNVLTALETNEALAKLYRGELFNQEWTSYALERLEDIKPGLQYLIPTGYAGLPNSTVYHKIGFHPDYDGYVENDAGIVVVHRNGREIAYAISIFTEKNPFKYSEVPFVQNLSRDVHKFFTQEEYIE